MENSCGGDVVVVGHHGVDGVMVVCPCRRTGQVTVFREGNLCRVVAGCKGIAHILGDGRSSVVKGKLIVLVVSARKSARPGDT